MSPHRLVPLTVASMALLALPPVAWAQTALDRGEVLVSERPVKGSDTPRVVVTAVINAPPARVWKIISHCGDYARTMPNIKRSREVYRKGNTVRCEVTVDLPFPYSDPTSLTECKHTFNKDKGVYRRSWRLLSGAYEINEGAWTLRPYKGDKNRTLARYWARAKTKAWVPGWVRTLAQKKSLPKMMERIREQAGAK